MAKKQKFSIGQKFVSMHEQRVVLVKLAGERFDCYVEKVETLSEIIEDPELLYQRMKKISRSKKIKAHPDMIPGNYVPYYEITTLKPTSTDVVLETIHRQQSDEEEISTAAVLGTLHRQEDFYRPIAETPELHEPREGLEDAIRELHTKIENNTAKLKDFMDLRSGRDEFINLKGEKLAELVPINVKSVLCSELRGEEWNELFVDRIYRWWLRGLCIEAAIIKVRVDREVSLNAMKSACKKIN